MQLKFAAPNLRQPIRRPYKELYGSDYIAAKYCGFRKPPRRAPDLWQHGVIPESLELVQPEQIFGVAMSDLPSLQYWVATKRLEEFMRTRGFANVRAIGMPITYVSNPQVERKEEALLVMPPHSIDAMNIRWSPQVYVDAIQSIRKQFREIVVCVNNLCWNSGLWVPEFQAAGFKVIRGADSKDPKTLEHMASLFRQFEFVTTNAYGSHLAYASFFGAKVSIFGPYFELSGESLQNIPFYVDNPHLIPLAIASSSEETVRKYYPAFFRTPAEATDQTDWGRRAVGWDQRVSPSEMRKLFGWTLRDRVQERITGRIKKLETPKTRPKAEDMELKRLKAMTTFEPGHAELFGRKFEFIDASTYLKMFDKHFKRQLYHFKASTERPLIIDGGANIGLSVLFFKCLYPAARVIASEADPAIAEVLERNCGTYELPDVQVVPKALWKCEDLVPFLQEGSLWGRFSNTANGAQVRSVPACRLGDFLNERVDLLKLDIEGAETEVLPDCAQQLHNVENIILEHHSFSNKPQRLDLVVNLLTEAGFRLYIEPAAQAKRPLFQRQFTSGMDVQMTIFGFRP